MTEDDILQVENVGAVVGRELTHQAFLALALATLGMVLYITLRFEFKFAVSTIAALLHDALVVLGIFALFRLEINIPFVAAILTIIGYSVNDTIVIIDRIRENRPKDESPPPGSGKEAEGKKEKNLVLSERVIGLGLKYPEHLPALLENLPPEAVNMEFRNLYKRLKIYYTKNHQFDYKGFLEEIRSLESDLLGKIDLLNLLVEKDFEEGISDKFIKTEIFESVKFLKQAFIRAEIKKIGGKIKEAEKNEKAGETEVLIKEFNHLIGEMKNLS